MKAAPWVLAGLLLLTTLGATYAYVGAAREREVAQANHRAALDTTRAHLVDSLEAKSRLLEQAQIQVADLGLALQTALRDREAEARVATRLRVALDSVTLLAQKPVRDTVFPTATGPVREAVFEMQGPPIFGQQVVRAGTEIRLDSRLHVSPFGIAYSVGCADHDAVVSWSVPEWVSASFESGRIDPVVCNPLQTGGLLRLDLGTGIAFSAGVIVSLLLQIAR